MRKIFFIFHLILTLLCADYNKEEFEVRYDNYSKTDKNIINKHLKLALKNLDNKKDELNVVASINDYLYQYFVYKNNLGTPNQLLKDGYAICGGTAVTMTEMLYAYGIKSRLAFLIGIPNQGAHSLVEVFFKNGQRGLFDPTFGLFWYDVNKNKTISIYELLNNPSLAINMLYETEHKKREKLNDKIKSFTSWKIHYKNKKDYEHSYYDPYLSFLERDAGGVAGEGIKSFVNLELYPSKIYM